MLIRDIIRELKGEAVAFVAVVPLGSRVHARFDVESEQGMTTYDFWGVYIGHDLEYPHPIRVEAQGEEWLLDVDDIVEIADD